MKSIEKQNVKLNVGFDGQPTEELSLKAYVFNQKGKLIEAAPLKKTAANLKVSKSDLKHSRLFIAPESKNDNKEERLELADMAKRVAYEAQIPNLKSNQLKLTPIPKFNWENWCWLACRVRGRVVKSISVNGSDTNMPVCHARVHICEVDKLKLIIPTIPDDILIDLRDIIINPPLPEPIPRPIPIPLPVPDPVPFKELSTFQNIDFEVKKQFQVQSPKLIREALLSNFQLLHPYLCLTPRFWPFFYRCDELRTVLTDHQGRFDTTIFHPCADQPDLYFWVEYMIDGSWETVYKPSIPCHTYWDYRCGSEVTITLDDERVDVCGELPGPEGSDSVEIVKVGSGAFVSHIQQQEAATSNIQGEILQTVGLTDLGLGSGYYRRPFGGSLGFRVHFGSSYPIVGGITHYRWSYRRIRNANLSPNLGAWKEITNPAYIRYYEEEGARFTKKAYSLGPDPAFVNTGFKIPPRRAEDIDVANPRNLDRTWVLEEWNSAIINTLFTGVSALQRQNDAGLYEFKFELLTQNGNGFDVAVVDQDTFQIPKFNETDVSVDAPDINLILAPGNKASGFRMKLRVDNNKCEADIFPVRVNAQEANECGFVQYQNANIQNAELSFKAFHPNNFANLSFRVRKGTEKDGLGRPVYRERASGMVIGDTTQGYNRAAGGVFTKNVPIHDLLGNCVDAAFGEYLYVDALATNGSTNELGYDASSLAGFALQKQ